MGTENLKPVAFLERDAISHSISGVWCPRLVLPILLDFTLGGLLHGVFWVLHEIHLFQSCGVRPPMSHVSFTKEIIEYVWDL
jgi:hypothetical protein